MTASAILALSALASHVWAGQRVALVIGNGSYAHASALANPLNDAADIGTSLERLGFKVTRIVNADRAELWDGLQKFSLAASASEVAVVFYAGHGIEVDRRNFLVPVDARLLSDADVEFETVPLDLLMRTVERTRGLRLIILDACRNNPFAAAMQRAGATRSIGRGLARVEPSGETLVAYAAKEGTVAADGEGRRNSPYTSALLAQLEEPGLEVGLMFRRVRDAVLASTGGQQEPFVYGSLSSRGAYLAAAPEPAPSPDPAPPPSDASAESRPAHVGITSEEVAARAYEAAERVNTVTVYKAVVRRFPGSIYAELAQAQIGKLTKVATASSEEMEVEPATEAAAQQKPDVQAAVAPEEREQAVSAEPPAPAPETIEGALNLTREERRRIQQGLASLGFNPGPADGLFGRDTRKALERWQSSQKMATTGYLDAETAKTLLGAQPKTSITVQAIPQDAKVRVFTASGSTYRDAMVVQPGQYEIAVDAPNHEPFRQRLAVEGPTTYKISLCKLEEKVEKICKDGPVTRTKKVQKSHDKRLVGRGIQSFESIFGSLINPTGWANKEAKRKVRQYCANAREDAKRNIERECKKLGGTVDRSTFRTTREQCDLKNPKRIAVVEGSLVCKGIWGVVEERYTEKEKECRNTIKKVRICPDEIVTKLR